MKKNSTKRLVQTALFIALALVLRQFSFMIPFGGANGMRIGVSEVFTKMPALLFGPALGGAASGLVDFLSQVIKSEGAYLWPILFVMIFGGVLTAILWKIMRRIPSGALKKGFLIFCTLLLALGIADFVVEGFFRESAWYGLLSALGDKVYFSTWGLVTAALFGFVFLFADLILKKKAGDKYNDDFLQLTLTVFLSDFSVTTLNTFVLRYYYSGLAKIPFWTYYLPRVIQDLITSVIFAYILSCLIKIYNKIIQERE